MYILCHIKVTVNLLADTCGYSAVITITQSKNIMDIIVKYS